LVSVAVPRHLRPQQRAPQVDLVGLVEPSGVDADRRASVRVGGRVVDEDVHRAEAVQRRLHARFGILLTPDVPREPGDVAVGRGALQLRRSRLEPLGFARHEHDGGTGVDEGPGDPQADPARPAGHDGDLSLQRQPHGDERNHATAGPEMADESVAIPTRRTAEFPSRPSSIR
jgi:hypothetical protein